MKTNTNGAEPTQQHHNQEHAQTPLRKTGPPLIHAEEKTPWLPWEEQARDTPTKMKRPTLQLSRAAISPAASATLQHRRLPNTIAAQACRNITGHWPQLQFSRAATSLVAGCHAGPEAVHQPSRWLSHPNGQRWHSTWRLYWESCSTPCVFGIA
jgi:hypothetical protein